MVINGITILAVIAIAILYYYIGYQHGKESTSKKFLKDLQEVMSPKDIPGSY